jgi:hypothetical protein
MTKQPTSRLTYPNPFSPSGIDFELPDNAWVTLKIFNTTGREVATLIDNVLYSAGTHHVDFGSAPWDHRPSEVEEAYFYRLSVEQNGKNYVDTKKIVLTK